MSVSSAMYAGITGLNAMGTAMSVISNNIANVNTVGYKRARSYFADLLSQQNHSASGSQQIGRGVQLAAVTQVFSQGSFQNSPQASDIAIAGEGFFKVRDDVTGEEFFTRAGNFIFDNEGRMQTPTGYVLQGWEVIPGSDPVQTTGAETDVVMSTFNVDPEVTDLVTFITNLDEREESRYNGPPFSTAWDGSDTNSPIDGTNYVYQTALRIYDSLGDGHDLSIYFDPHDTLDNVWDYIIACDPEDDARLDANGRSVSGQPIAGLLQRGSITFSNTGPDGTGGQIVDITADTLANFTVASAGPASSANVSVGGAYTGASARTYTATWITSGGGAGGLSGPPYPILRWVDDDVPPNSGNVTMAGTGPNALVNGVSLSFNSASVVSGSNFTFTTIPATETWASAVPNNDGYFEFTAAFVTSAGPVVPTQQVIAVDLGASNPNGVNATWTLDNESTTQYAAPSVTLLQTQNGFSSGYLQSISIDPDGIMTGTYSNGRILSTYQIGLALFRSPWGLDKVGNNLYRETRDSGDHVFNRPGSGGVGTISPNSLENSNVDLAEEFVDMIVQQRGFQANSKVITTTDTMLAELINLKR